MVEKLRADGDLSTSLIQNNQSFAEMSMSGTGDPGQQYDWTL